MTFRAAIASLPLVAALLVPTAARAEDARSLRGEIERHHPGIPWVSTARLAEWLSGPEAERPILLDVRRRDEFATSHLAGAIRVDPDRPAIAELALPAGRRIVVYCSVGYRSADIGRQLQAAGHSQVWNLLGGLFQWANDGRPLFRGTSRASLVHPYDAEWGRYLLPRHRAPLAPPRSP